MGMDSIDVGTFAQRPLPRTSTEGKFYLARDTNELFIQDDGTWKLASVVGSAGVGDVVLDFTNKDNLPVLGTTDLVSTSGQNAIPQILLGLLDNESGYQQVAPEIVQNFIVANRTSAQNIPAGVFTQLTYNNVIQQHAGGLLTQDPAFSGNFSIDAESHPQMTGGLYAVKAKVTLTTTGPTSLNNITFRALVNGVVIDQAKKNGAGLGGADNDLILDFLYPNLVLTGDLTFEVLHDDAQDLATVGSATNLLTSVSIVRVTQTEVVTL